MQALAQQNNNYKYILMIIDVFTKFGWAIPLKFKSGESARTELEAIFSQRTPKKLWADHRNEFYNIKVQRLLKKHNIELDSTENEEKCSAIERWNRTIKTKLWKYFTANGTHRWIDILQPLMGHIFMRGCSTRVTSYYAHNFLSKLGLITILEICY